MSETPLTVAERAVLAESVQYVMPLRMEACHRDLRAAVERIVAARVTAAKEQMFTVWEALLEHDEKVGGGFIQPAIRNIITAEREQIARATQ